MGFEASKLVCISLVFPENSPAGRDYVADIASEVGFNREESDRYMCIKGSFYPHVTWDPYKGNIDV